MCNLCEREQFSSGASVSCEGRAAAATVLSQRNLIWMMCNVSHFGLGSQCEWFISSLLFYLCAAPLPFYQSHRSKYCGAAAARATVGDALNPLFSQSFCFEHHLISKACRYSSSMTINWLAWCLLALVTDVTHICPWTNTLSHRGASMALLSMDYTWISNSSSSLWSINIKRERGMFAYFCSYSNCRFDFQKL